MTNEVYVAQISVWWDNESDGMRFAGVAKTRDRAIKALQDVVEEKIFEARDADYNGNSREEYELYDKETSEIISDATPKIKALFTNSNCVDFYVDKTSQGFVMLVERKPLLD